MNRRSRPAALALAVCLAAPLAAAEEPAKSPYAALGFRFIGPPGNRVSAVTGVPGDSNVCYAGAASGGVWKTTDGGTHWKPIFDDEAAQSIGAITIAPSDPNVIWVGTGESFIRSNVSIGNGVYRSTDAGATWTHLGLEKTGRIPRIVVDPRNPDVALVAALGTCYGPQQERGVYRTTDGGKSWARVLFVDESTGVSDLTMAATNPRVLFAGAWPIDIKTWGRKSGGSSGGVYVSKDGGSTWKKLTGHGLPDPPIGKVAVNVAPSDGSRVYALIETGQRGSLWRSDDGGGEWRRVSQSRLLNERPHYYTRMLVMPDNANEVYFPSNQMGVTYDGGETSEQIRWGGDNHDMWADPKNPSRIMIGNDGGVYITTTRGKSWTSIRLPIGQMYHVAVDDRVPYMVYGQMQDDGSMRGPSNSKSDYGILPGQWTTTAGCETGWTTPDPVDPDVVWGGCYAGVVERFDAKTGQARTVSVWPERTMGAPAGTIKHRMNWTYPIAISPHDHNRVWVGSQYVNETTDGGQTWRQISPDLTRNDPAMMGDSGGLTVDNLSVEYAGVVFAIAESPLERGVVWAGTNDGVLQVTKDGGAHWENVTPKLPGVPAKGTISSVDPSRHGKGVCYVAVDGHQVDDRDPHLYRTSDYGKTWREIVGGIPKSPMSYAHVVKESPHRKGLLFAGTENALYVSFDDGGKWEPLQSKLPHAPVHWLTVQERFHDLVVATYGRGFYILDDTTPLEALTDQVRAEAAHLFAPREAYRFRGAPVPALAPTGTSRGRNPAYGASINYWLKEKLETPHVDPAAELDEADKPKKPVEITILDEKGTLIRTLHGPSGAGLNRTSWDLRYEPTEEVRLRTTPPGNPHVAEEKRFRGKSSRAVFYYGISEPKRGPLVPPGTYTVRLMVNGKEAGSQKLVVKKDPSSAGSEADVAAATKLSLALWNDTNTAARLINELEWTRRQLEARRAMLKARKAPAADFATLDAVAKDASALEDELIHPTLAEADMKSFRGALGLYLKLVWLQAESGTGGGDVSGNADMAPTKAELDVYDLLSGKLKDVKARVDAFHAGLAKGPMPLMTVSEPPTPPRAAAEEDEDDDDY